MRSDFGKRKSIVFSVLYVFDFWIRLMLHDYSQFFHEIFRRVCCRCWFHVALLQSSLSNVCLLTGGTGVYGSTSPTRWIRSDPTRGCPWDLQHKARSRDSRHNGRPRSWQVCLWIRDEWQNKKTPRPHRTKLNQSHASETQMKIPNQNLTNCHSKLQITSVFDGSSAPVGLLHCGGHMKPAQQCTKQLIIALVQSRGQIWTPWWFTIIWRNKLRKRFSNVHFTHFRLHACVRQLDSLEVALVIVSWWEPNCGGASKTCSAKKSLTFSIPHGVPQPARTSLAGLRRGCFSSHDLGKIVQVILRPSSSST